VQRPSLLAVVAFASHRSQSVPVLGAAALSSHLPLPLNLLLEMLFSCIALSIQDLPVELICVVCLYLSVKDLCFVRAVSRCVCFTLRFLIVFFSSQTNNHLRSILSEKTIWRDVVRDILTVKPLLRLSYAHVDMTSSQLRGTAIRLAAQDKLLRQHRKGPLVLQHTFGVDGVCQSPLRQYPVLLPGGRHFVLPNSSMKELRLFKTDGTPDSVGLLVPKSKRPGCYSEYNSVHRH
jgi:hypothetical protein